RCRPDLGQAFAHRGLSSRREAILGRRGMRDDGGGGGIKKKYKRQFLRRYRPDRYFSLIPAAFVFSRKNMCQSANSGRLGLRIKQCRSRFTRRFRRQRQPNRPGRAASLPRQTVRGAAPLFRKKEITCATRNLLRQ